ncbi:MAG: hypothetical protein M0P12_00655 [Paludibacteraceae bacterium]|nr:hypothetical protein [Paludibacteraceae bacterium]MCK9615607.1 hypothetical protein [Candidatus Omnitrophota bacterium]
MAEHVIITGVRRARELVGIQELKQMCGRGGRTQDGRTYCADIILTYDDMVIEDSLQKEKSMPVISTLSDMKNLCFYLLPRLSIIGRFTESDIQHLYSKTFAFFQGKEIEISKVISYLEENEAIVEVTGMEKTRSWTVDSLGTIASRLFLPVKDVKLLYDNFLSLKKNGDIEKDACLAWALGNLDSIRITGDYGEYHREEISNFKGDLPVDYSCEDGAILTASLWWCILGNGIPGKNMSTNVRKLKKTWHRLRQALSWFPEFEGNIKVLDIRITRSVRMELVPFFENCPFQMSKNRAISLYEIGYRSWEGTESVETDD